MKGLNSCVHLFFIIFIFNYSIIDVNSAIWSGGPLISRLAKNIVQYFHLDKFEVANSYHHYNDDHHYDHKTWNHSSNHTSECDTLKGIEEYFFNVYSSDNNLLNITHNDVDDIIHYHILRTRNKKNEERHRRHKCHRQNCYHSKDIFDISNLKTITRENFKDACMVLLYNIELNGCSIVQFGSSLSRGAVWGIGIVFATIVTLWSWIGALVLPFVHSEMYKLILAGMIALACGCVLSNSLLNFIPMSVGNVYVNLENPDDSYFLKHLLFIGVIFFFFNFERGMKLWAFYKKEKEDENKKKEEYLMKNQLRRASLSSLHKKDPINEFNNDDDEKPKAIKLTSFKNNEQNPKKSGRPKLQKRESIDLAEISIMGVSHIDEITDKFPNKFPRNESNDNINTFRRQDSSSSTNTLSDEKPQRICCTSLTKGMSKVRPIGWMAIFGDGLSNFIDGLSIGAAINQGITSGLTVAISVWFGNIPQELGDFALLVRAGMSPFQALFYNYLSALSCYIGFTVGCLAGEAINVARWIFAISGGTTLYIGLGVLLPEIVEEFEDAESFRDKVKITIIQLAGLMTGFLIMIFLNMYEDQIEI